MSVPGGIKALARPLLRLVGLRPPDLKARVRYGEVCMDNVELAGLVRAVRSLDVAPACIVEIGSYCGGSTVVIGRAAARRNAAVKVYAVEPFAFAEARYQHDYESLFDRNVADWELGGVIEKVRKRSEDVAPAWTRPIDFLYVDGDHDYAAVARDIRGFVPHVRPGGLVAFHDYKPQGKEGVRRAVDELVVPHHERIFLAGSLVCFRTRGGGA